MDPVLKKRLDDNLVNTRKAVGAVSAAELIDEARRRSHEPKLYDMWENLTPSPAAREKYVRELLGKNGLWTGSAEVPEGPSQTSSAQVPAGKERFGLTWGDRLPLYPGGPKYPIGVPIRVVIEYPPPTWGIRQAQKSWYRKVRNVATIVSVIGFLAVLLVWWPVTQYMMIVTASGPPSGPITNYPFPVPFDGGIWTGMPWYAVALLVFFACIPLVLWGNWLAARRRHFSFPAYELALPSSDGKSVGGLLTIYGDIKILDFDGAEPGRWAEILKIPREDHEILHSDEADQQTVQPPSETQRTHPNGHGNGPA